MAINTNVLKAYAPEARRAFIAAVKARAARFGITEQGSSPIREEGNVAIINGQPYPRSFAQQRRDLDRKIAVRGYSLVMEEVAYTWFNRFAAIRYMELHDYLDHGVRVLSNPNGGSTPEIVEKAAQVEMPGLKREQVIALKLDGTKDDELYRMLIVAQCNALHAVMPFLFEKIEDETELLLPDNLLHSESLIRQLVERIPEGDWQHIEIIGWLYQFYISEKKDQVIGNVVKSEDIPAATQLFTPNWIVKYMVQNSLGAKWLATYPTSALRDKMEYFVPAGEQPAQVQMQIETETPQALDLEAMTFLDPASGSGHILVEAYNLFRELYLERGYRLREIPRLILEKNVYGLDIDDRAAQLTGFALMMRARADDRQILSVENPVRLNVLSIQESRGLDVDKLANALAPAARRFELFPAGDLLPETVSQPTLAIAEALAPERNTIADLISLFQEARTLGSLISVPPTLADALPALSSKLHAADANDLIDIAVRAGADGLITALVRQAELLGRDYDVVAANPPYMGSRGMNGRLKEFAQKHYPSGKNDLFAMFIERGLDLTKPQGHCAMVTMETWMFLSSFEDLRSRALEAVTIGSMVHMPYLGKGGTSMGISFGTTVFAFQKRSMPDCAASYYALRYFETDASGVPLRFPPENDRSSRLAIRDFQAIPGSPISYWASEPMRQAFAGPKLWEQGDTRRGLQTGAKERFIKSWWEVSAQRIEWTAHSKEAALVSDKRWFKFNNGGIARKWYGNLDLVVDWEENGARIKSTDNAIIPSEDRYFSSAVCWSRITSGLETFRIHPAGVLPGDLAPCFYAEDPHFFMSYFNSIASRSFKGVVNPTMTNTVGDLARIPGPVLETSEKLRCTAAAVRLEEIHKADWDEFEGSWGFERSPILSGHLPGNSFSDACETHASRWANLANEALRLEQEINEIFLRRFGLSGLSPMVPVREITLTNNPSYRYGENVGAELESMLLADKVREFLSYSVGCMFGRYSIDAPGLILGSEAETLQEYMDRVHVHSFLPDADNVIPVTDDVWFTDDVTDRFLEFLRITFGEARFGENLAFVEAAIGKDVRKFFKRDFYADHLRRYRKRPIYWLFSSGKEKAFEALVYLHRYNEGTLARMRLEYVVPLQTQMAGRVQRLTDELRAGNLSSSETKKRNLQLEKLQKQQDELRRFEEELHHFADRRIKLDLDDGVKVNYGKFGNLLADVKAITGGKDDE